MASWKLFITAAILVSVIAAAALLVRADVSSGGAYANFVLSPSTGYAPLTVNITDASMNAVSWNWTFGDGSTSTLENPLNHTYSAVGNYTVTLTVWDPMGYSNTTSQTVTVFAKPPAPKANFTASPTKGVAPLAIKFNDTSSSTPSSWQWNFGDGSANSTLQNPSHTYNKSGTYTVALTAGNVGGSNTIVKTNMINVTQPVPVSSFTANLTSGIAPLTVQFTDTSSGSPTNWSWSFGDGAANSTLKNPVHTYANPGVYSVILTASSVNGSSTKQVNNYITVYTSTYPVVQFSASSYVFNEANSTVSITVSKNPGTWAWNSKVNYTFVNDSALLGVDYAAANGEAMTKLNMIPNSDLNGTEGSKPTGWTEFYGYTDTYCGVNSTYADGEMKAVRMTNANASHSVALLSSPIYVDNVSYTYSAYMKRLSGNATSSYVGLMYYYSNGSLIGYDYPVKSGGDVPQTMTRYSAMVNPVAAHPGTAYVKVFIVGAYRVNSDVLVTKPMFVPTGTNLSWASDSMVRPTGSLTFAPNESSKTITVKLLNNNKNDPTLYFKVGLSGAVNASIGTNNYATIGISEANATPSVQFSATGYTFNETAGTAIVTVTKSGSASRPFSVKYATSNGSALAGVNYNATSGTLSFNATDTSKTFTISLRDDGKYDVQKYFNLSLSSPVNATLGSPGTVKVYVNNKDAAPTVQFSAFSYTYNETAGNVTITITQAGQTNLNTVVNYSTSPGTATPGVNYNSTSGTLTFLPANASKTFTVHLIDDGVYSAQKYFYLNLTGAVNAGYGTNRNVTVYVNNAMVPAPVASFTSDVSAGDSTLTVHFADLSVSHYENNIDNPGIDSGLPSVFGSNAVSYTSSYMYSHGSGNSLSITSTNASADSFLLLGSNNYYVASNTSVYWEAWVYSPTTTYLNAQNCFIQESGGQWRGVAYGGTGVITLPAGVWTKINGSGTTYSDWLGTAHLVIRPAINPNGTYDTSKTLYYDDFVAYSKNYINNPDIEAGLPNVPGCSAVNYAQSSAYAHHGTHSISVVSTDASADSHLTLGRSSYYIAPDTSVYWEAWVYSPTTTYLNAQNCFIQENGGQWRGIANAGTGIITLPGGTWTKINGSGTTCSDWLNTTRLVIRPAINPDGTYDTGKTLYYDDFVITSQTPTTLWQWNFGDGSPNSTVQNPIHTFPANNGSNNITYNVILTVKNNGGTCSCQRTITVLPEIIKILKNTETTQIVQTGDVLLTLNADAGHTYAVMQIKNLTTNESDYLNFNITKFNDPVNGTRYEVKIYYNGSLVSTAIADYDPLEPGVLATQNTAMANSVQARSVVSAQSTQPAFLFKWDGIDFISQGDSPNGYIKYPHPFAYDEYSDLEDKTITINGNSLSYLHYSKEESKNIATVSPMLVFGLMGGTVGAGAGLIFPPAAPFTGFAGGVLGGVIGALIGNHDLIYMTDEHGCIWQITRYTDRMEYKMVANSIETDDYGVGKPAPLSSQYITDTIPTTMEAGQAYGVSVEMNNIGSANWLEYPLHIRLAAKNDDADKFTPDRMYIRPAFKIDTNSISEAKIVHPGDTYMFQYTMTAPSMPGTYNVEYGMIWDGSNPTWFDHGDTISKTITVTNPAPITYWFDLSASGPYNPATGQNDPIAGIPFTVSLNGAAICGGETGADGHLMLQIPTPVDGNVYTLSWTYQDGETFSETWTYPNMPFNVDGNRRILVFGV